MAPNSTSSAVDTTAIKSVVIQHIGLTATPESLDPQTDLYTIGLTSLATVGLMLALEDHFNVEFPESMLGRATFRSVASITDAISKLSN
jgi:acyl carrier protein